MPTEHTATSTNGRALRRVSVELPALGCSWTIRETPHGGGLVSHQVEPGAAAAFLFHDDDFRRALNRAATLAERKGAPVKPRPLPVWTERKVGGGK